MEVIIAVCESDPTCAQLAAIVQDPARLLIIKHPAGVPKLRREATLQARGDLIVITEDHCRFPRGWLDGLVRASEEHPGAVCGGPVDNGRRTLAGWAQYFSRYSAFLPKCTAAQVRTLPGNNACYPGRLISDRLALLEEGFWEAEFNHALASDGVTFRLIPALAVTQYQQRGLIEYIPLRFRHGRCYGARRFQSLPNADRVKLLIRSPTLPFLLLFRIARSVVRARWKMGVLLAVSPIILLYVFAWSVGEVTGYLAGAGRSCSDTD